MVAADASLPPVAVMGSTTQSPFEHRWPRGQTAPSQLPLQVPRFAVGACGAALIVATRIEAQVLFAEFARVALRARAALSLGVEVALNE
ncbi:MAG: hypothetical protein ABUL62_28020 [Myxococcales bacterium]